MLSGLIKGMELYSYAKWPQDPDLEETGCAGVARKGALCLG